MNTLRLLVYIAKFYILKGWVNVYHYWLYINVPIFTTYLTTEYYQLLFVSLYIYFYLLFIVVQVESSPFLPHHAPPPYPSPLPTLETTPFGFVHVSFIYLSWWPFPYFAPLSLSLLPSSYCHFVHFNFSGCILLACLFWWLDSTYRWDHMVLAFHCLAYFI